MRYTGLMNMVVVTMIKRQGSDQVIQIQSSIKQLKFASRTGVILTDQ